MSFRCYVTVDGTAGPEQNLARLGTLGAGVAYRLEFVSIGAAAASAVTPGGTSRRAIKARCLSPFLELINWSHVGELTMIRQVTIAFIAVGCPTTASAEDILLQVGGRFSIYAPPSCHRLEQLHF